MEIKLIEDGGEWEQIGELTFEMDRKAKLPNSLYVSDYYEYMIFRKYKEEKKEGKDICQK